MNILIMGPPGSGKGTQAKMIATTFKIPHISTGDMIRENIKNETALGKVAKALVDNGQLVPDDIIIRVMRKRLISEDCKNGYILDGFPRTVNQAEELEKISDVEFVINLEVESNILVDRISKRRMCKCGSSYHLELKPPEREGICDRCGGELYQREDDKKETVVKRLEIYHSETEPLINFYNAKHILHNIKGDKAIDEVFEDITQIIG